MLEDGSDWSGIASGRNVSAIGEVVFNTGMIGHQETITDPCSAGQILVMTYPLIGNPGIHPDHFEARSPSIAGLVTREACSRPVHAGSRGNLHSYMKENGIPLAGGFDTRAIARHLRSHGTMQGILTSDMTSPAGALADNIRDARGPGDLRPGCRHPYTVGEGKSRVIVIDLGVNKNLIKMLTDSGVSCWVLPMDSDLSAIDEYQADAIVISNGPGDPRAVDFLLPGVRQLCDGYPVFGFGLGHQVLGRAFGAQSFKLAHGHRGGNYPVKDVVRGKSCITVQNHGYALECSSLRGTRLELTHVNLNDDTVEGIRHRDLAIAGIQFHPSADPEPGGARDAMVSFLEDAGLDVIPVA